MANRSNELPMDRNTAASCSAVLTCSSRDSMIEVQPLNAAAPREQARTKRAIFIGSLCPLSRHPQETDNITQRPSGNTAARRRTVRPDESGCNGQPHPCSCPAAPPRPCAVRARCTATLAEGLRLDVLKDRVNLTPAQRPEVIASSQRKGTSANHRREPQGIPGNRSASSRTNPRNLHLPGRARMRCIVNPEPKSRRCPKKGIQ